MADLTEEEALGSVDVGEPNAGDLRPACFGGTREGRFGVELGLPVGERRAFRARYARSLIEAGLDPLVTISPAGLITDVNEATGVPREGLIGTDFSQYVTDPDKAQEGYRRAFEQGSLTDYPLTLVHRDGTLTDTLYHPTVYPDFNENVLGVLAVARDATALRARQQLSGQLQRALQSRIIIEQAKGITAQRHGVTIDEAYQLIPLTPVTTTSAFRVVAEAIVQVRLEV